MLHFPLIKPYENKSIKLIFFLPEKLGKLRNHHKTEDDIRKHEKQQISAACIDDSTIV